MSLLTTYDEQVSNPFIKIKPYSLPTNIEVRNYPSQHLPAQN